MKTKLYIIALLFLSFYSHLTVAQEKEKIMAEAKEKDTFEKKFRWGLSGNQYWGNIKGNNLAKTYFGKPCVGFNLRAEYYPVSFIGVGAGVGIQQRGAGIINPDVSGGSFTHPWQLPQGNPDSTYRERLRFNTWEIPVTILLRTPKDIIKGVRLSAAVGLSYVHVSKVDDVFLSVEDGFHLDQVVSKDYLPKDLAYQISFGTDISAGAGNLLQVHLVYTKGTKNLYAAGQGDGRLETYGFRLAWLY